MRKKKEGSILGGILLIAGSCIGAGMLGLPIVTGIAGLLPTLVMFFLAYLFMTSTALLLVEEMGRFNQSVNFISMVSRTLGPIGKTLCWLLYLFLFYALLVAYMTLSGIHFSSFLARAFDFSVPVWGGTLFFILIFASLIYLGTKPVDHVNRFLMFWKIIAFLLFIFAGFHFLQPKLLLHIEKKYALFSFPILIISFGFHNMVPSLMHYVGNDRKRARKIIWGGSLFTLVVYLIWEIIVLALLPVGQKDGIWESFHKGIDAAEALRHYLGSGALSFSVQWLAFFAILTSFLSQALSLVHFLRDGFKMEKKKRENITVCSLALLPPLLFSLLFPNLFFQALDFAGGICTVILFGIFPALMVWIGRYKKKERLPDQVPGGKPLLVLIFAVASFVFFYQLTQMLGFNLFPKP
ncbi:MAG: tyrosine transporter [Simkania negevensis]|nr:tyrosine transporter [Simkania negevensis]